MKVLMTNDSIVSLENVRRVTKQVFETKHTSRGVPYTLIHHQICISYLGDQRGETIDCGNNDNGAKVCAELFQTIYEKLSEG